MAAGKTTADVVDVLSGIFANTTEMAARIGKMEKNMSSKPSVSDLTSPAKKGAEVKKKKEGSISDVISSIKSLKDVDAKDVIKFSMLPLGLVAKKLEAFTKKLSGIDAKSVKTASEIMTSMVELVKFTATTGLKDIAKARLALGEMQKFYLGTRSEDGIIVSISKVSDQITTLFDAKALATFDTNIKIIEGVMNSMNGIVELAKKHGKFANIKLGLAMAGLRTIDIVASATVGLAAKLVAKAKGLGTAVKDGVLPIAKFALISSLIVFSAAGIGAMFVLKPKTMLYAAAGLAAIAVTSLAIAGLGILIDKVKTITKKNYKSILPIVAFVGASSLILIAATGIGVLIKEHLKEALIGLGGIVVTVAAVAGIAWLVDRVKTMTMKGLLGFLPLFGIAAMSSLMLMATVGVGVYAEKNGGWKRIGKTLAQIGSIIGAYSLVAAASIAALPYAWLGLTGFVPIGLVAAASIGLTKETAKVGESIDKAGGEEGLKKTVSIIASTINQFSDEICAALRKIKGRKELVKSAVTLSLLMNPVTKFVDIVSKLGVSQDGSQIKTMYFDKDGNEKVGHTVDIEKIGTAIASGFVKFSEAILDGLSRANTPEKGRKKIRLIRKVMNPVSKFVDLASKFDAVAEGDTVKLSVLTLDENGNIKGKRTVDISKVGSTIANAFVIFSDKILDGLAKAETPSKGKRKIKLITKMMDPVSKFATMVSEITDANGNIVATEVDEEGKIIKKTPIDLTKSANAIVAGMTTFTSKLNEGIDKMDKGLFEKSGILGLGKTKLNEITSSLSAAIEDSLRPYKDLDNDKLSNALTTLNDKHIAYLDKLTASIEKTKSPMREYIDEMKELTESYEKLQPLIKDDKQIILTVDKHEETNSNVNIDQNNFTKMYGEVMPMIHETVSKAVSKALEDLTLSIPKDLSTKGGMITTTVG